MINVGKDSFLKSRVQVKNIVKIERQIMILWTQSGLSKLGQLHCHDPWFVIWTPKCIMNYTSKCVFFSGMVSWM